MKTRLQPSGSRLRLGGILCAAALMALSGCTVVTTYSPPVISRPQQPATPPAPSGPVASWTGTYRTVLPCGHCAGIRLDLTLYRDATFDLLTHELGTDRAPNTRRGGFTFNNDETRIMLDANGQNRSFDILPPNRLRMLGKDGQVVTGPDAYRFILKK
ncbi:MAG: copper resistance protein NlpE [Brachymonas sp.]|nr:copper resistance protein NlpE [Brachymonas sp.]